MKKLYSNIKILLVINITINSKHHKCSAKGQYIIEKKNLIAQQCNKNINQTNLNYDIIINLLVKNKLNDTIKKIQKYIVKYIFNKNKTENNIDITKCSRQLTKEKFLLNNIEFSKIKNQIFGTLFNLLLEELVKIF